MEGGKRHPPLLIKYNNKNQCKINILYELNNKGVIKIQTENIKLYKGDCLEVMDRLIEQGINVDAIICDLPYGTTQNKWDGVIPLRELWERYDKLIKSNGVIILFGSEPFTSQLILSNLKNFKYRITWDKSQVTNFLNAKRQPLRKVEDLCVFYKKQPTYNPQFGKGIPYTITRNHETSNYGKQRENQTENKGERYPTDLINFPQKREGLHPTQKPTELLEYLIKTYTLDEQVVLDNTMGSGSTGVACINTNRKFIGIELDNTYYEIAKNRIEETLKNQGL